MLDEKAVFALVLSDKRDSLFRGGQKHNTERKQMRQDHVEQLYEQHIKRLPKEEQLRLLSLVV